MNASTWRMDVFCHVYEGEMTDAKSLEQEPVEWFTVKALPPNVLQNLHLMIPFALEKIQLKGIHHFVVELT